MSYNDALNGIWISEEEWGLQGLDTTSDSEDTAETAEEIHINFSNAGPYSLRLVNSSTRLIVCSATISLVSTC